MNPNCEACVFLIRKNTERTHIHQHQQESVELQDDNNKKEGAEGPDASDDEGGQGKSVKKMAINLDLIAETIVGLKTYEVKIDDHKMNRYMRFSQSHNMPSVNIWAFVCAIILFMLNMVGK